MRTIVRITFFFLLMGFLGFLVFWGLRGSSVFSLVVSGKSVEVSSIVLGSDDSGSGVSVVNGCSAASNLPLSSSKLKA